MDTNTILTNRAIIDDGVKTIKATLNTLRSIATGLKRLEQAGILEGVKTTRIDELHNELLIAGSKLLELQSIADLELRKQQLIGTNTPQTPEQPKTWLGNQLQTLASKL